MTAGLAGAEHDEGSVGSHDGIHSYRPYPDWRSRAVSSSSRISAPNKMLRQPGWVFTTVISAVMVISSRLPAMVPR
jgi:hypothetical protein